MTRACIYTIPAGLSFVDVLAKGIQEMVGTDDPLALARVQVLLPTRRACRSLREAFLRLNEGKPMMPPRMNPIGDVDEEELSLTLSGVEEELSLPPALSPLRRQFLLARLIAARGQGRGLEQDLALAAALGRLMDQVYTEDLNLADLPKIVDKAEFADHWQISLDFLALLSEHWPNILIEQGVIDAADRRNRLLKALAAHWHNHPPVHKIIAAGSTGTIPATAALLKTIANLPDGCIVLPGLDQAMDEDSWQAMDDTHPQATLRTLLKELKQKRTDIALWPSVIGETEQKKTLRVLTSEIMRPADTAQEWQTVKQRLSFTPEELPIERYDCANPQEEALTIALALRRTLEDKTKTAALVTPDRKLARRVTMACRRWGIEIDDSGGQALSETKVGTYLRLCMEAVCADMKPVALLDFCKHALSVPAYDGDWRKDIRRLDETIFRGPAFEGGFEAYRKKLAMPRKDGKNVKGLDTVIDFLEAAFSPLLSLSQESPEKPFEEWLDAHLHVAENFCAPDRLWVHQDGEAASTFFSDLREQASLLPAMTAATYLALLEQTMKAVAVRPAYGLHPRLMILGQLEARLVEADVMVLSGLNEGTWPPKPSPDPWMSRPMRKRFGLPPQERSIGLSAHDFAQSLCADRIILTRATRVDGTPTVPSRWLQRMDTVLQACGHAPDSFQHGTLLAQARLIDHTQEFTPVERPEPRPPVATRPRRLSVTKIDTWMNDPYSIYARYILKLEPLPPLEEALDARLRGELIHKVLDRFVDAYPDALPADGTERFMVLAKEEMNNLSLTDDVKAFWEPRLMKVAQWLVMTETAWRKNFVPAAKGREAKGTMDFEGAAGPFTLSGIADRIDLSRDGRESAIIDYKSGGSFTKQGMLNGTYPQLPLEALMVEAGGFEIKATTVAALTYWVVNGSKDGGKETKIIDPAVLDQAKQNAREGLQQLIDTFDLESTPYYSLPRPDKAPRFNDYEHLARVREWTALDESESDAEDAA